jgi:hypothetical protein
MIAGFSTYNIRLAWGLLGLTWVLRNTGAVTNVVEDNLTISHEHEGSLREH